MFSYRRKLRSSHTTVLWGAKPNARAFCGRHVLTVEVEEIGDAVELSVHRSRSYFWRIDVLITLPPGGVYSIDLNGVFSVSATGKGGDSFVTCALLSAA